MMALITWAWKRKDNESGQSGRILSIGAGGRARFSESSCYLGPFRVADTSALTCRPTHWQLSGRWGWRGGKLAGLHSAGGSPDTPAGHRPGSGLLHPHTGPLPEPLGLPAIPEAISCDCFSVSFPLGRFLHQTTPLPAPYLSWIPEPIGVPINMLFFAYRFSLDFRRFQ